MFVWKQTKRTHIARSNYVNKANADCCSENQDSHDNLKVAIDLAILYWSLLPNLSLFTSYPRPSPPPEAIPRLCGRVVSSGPRHGFKECKNMVFE